LPALRPPAPCHRLALERLNGKAIFSQPAVNKCALHISQVCGKQPTVALNVISERDYSRIPQGQHDQSPGK
jgi:hypothetical protein